MAQLEALGCRDRFLSQCPCGLRRMCIFVLCIHMWRMNLAVQLSGKQIHSVVRVPGRGDYTNPSQDYKILELKRTIETLLLLLPLIFMVGETEARAVKRDSQELCS